MAETLTLMAVHAHPDDEASSTGGMLAQYSAQGIRTIVVTCTNGEFGDAPGQVKPGQDGHDEEAVAQLRLSELRESCKILGVTHLELLGYHDSGMPEWDYRNRPDAFCNVPLEVISARIVELIERYRPQVVVSYDPDGAYQHPDHIQAARAAARRGRRLGHPGQVLPDRVPPQQLAEDPGRAARGRGGRLGLGRSQPRGGGADGGRGSPDHHHDRHRERDSPEARGADVARQPDQRLLVQQDPARGGVRGRSATRTSSGSPTPAARRCRRPTCSPGFAR